MIIIVIVIAIVIACGRHGEFIFGGPISGSSNLDLSPGWGHCVVSTLTVPLSTQVYKWVMVNVMRGVAL